MRELVELYGNLTLPESSNVDFTALGIPSYEHHKIGKNRANNPVLLLEVSNYLQCSYNDIKLRNLSVLFNTKCRILNRNTVEEKRYVVVIFTSNDIHLKEYFFELCSSLLMLLGNSTTIENIRSQILKLSELLMLATEPGKKSIQGIWAELLIILESNNPVQLLQYWHIDPYDKFDFSFNDERLEVKSSTNTYRTHSFSLEQLNPIDGTKAIIASIIVKRVSVGKTVLDLVAEIESKLLGNSKLMEKLRRQVSLSLGSSLIDSDNYHFDFSMAKQSLKFFNTIDIPKINIDHVPKAVSDVRFSSDLSGSKQLTVTHFCSFEILSYFLKT